MGVWLRPAWPGLVWVWAAPAAVQPLARILVTTITNNHPVIWVHVHPVIWVHISLSVSCSLWVVSNQSVLTPVSYSLIIIVTIQQYGFVIWIFLILGLENVFYLESCKWQVLFYLKTCIYDKCILNLCKPLHFKNFILHMHTRMFYFYAKFIVFIVILIKL